MHPALDRNNPQSLSRLIDNPKFDSAMEEMLLKHPDLPGLTERELKKEIKRLSTPPDQDDLMLRMKFWFEYDCAMAEGRGMRIIKICAGVMDQMYFWDYIKKPLKLLWIVTPIPSYGQYLEAGLGAGMRKLCEFLELPVEDPFTGKINVQLLNAQAKIVMMLDMRKHGAFTQKIENRNLNVHASAGEVAAQIEALSMEEVEKRMKKLEENERDSLRIEAKASRPTYTIEVEK